MVASANGMVLGPHMPPLERFWLRVNKTSGCWLWTGATFSGGYGVFVINRKRILVHRFSYELHKTKIPDGLQIDHLCRTPLCVNPDHLEPVTAVENVMRGQSIPAKNARKELCSRGHDFSWINNQGFRVCRTCANALRRERYRRRKNGSK